MAGSVFRLPVPALQNGASALQTLLFGCSGFFRPRLAPGFQMGAQDVPALFDVGPMAKRLAELMDFDLLNSGAAKDVGDAGQS